MNSILAFVLVTAAAVVPRASIGPTLRQRSLDVARAHLPGNAVLQVLEVSDEHGRTVSRSPAVETGRLGDGHSYVAFIYKPAGTANLVLRVVANLGGGPVVFDKQLPGSYLWGQDFRTVGFQIADLDRGGGDDDIIAVTTVGASLGAYVEVLAVTPTGLVEQLGDPPNFYVGCYRFQVERSEDGRASLVVFGKWTEPENSTVSIYQWAGTAFRETNVGSDQYYREKEQGLLDTIYSKEPESAPIRSRPAIQLAGIYAKQRRYARALEICEDVLELLADPKLTVIPKRTLEQARSPDQRRRISADWQAGNLESQAEMHRIMGDVYNTMGKARRARDEYSQESRLKLAARKMRRNAEAGEPARTKRPRRVR